ncbi:MAG: DUF1259 domain-containing protein, partial [Verrucomicrobiota bacterium]|nr:DUF1259 domain-containing protein [Verrucomicrobiota bacterium]
MKKSLALLILAIAANGFAANELDTNKISEITGLKGKFNEQENVYKITLPRTDVKISVDGWQIPPFMGLTSWAAFTPGKKSEAMVMGDWVLFQDEVNAAMSVALDHGLQVTALHNHFFFDDPKVYFMHIAGEGDADKLAKGVRATLDTVKEIRAANPTPAKTFGKSPLPEKNSVSPEPLQKVLDNKGETKDGMFKAVFGRKAKMACGCEVGKEMGVNTWAAFAGADDNALVDGDFVVLETELQGVLKSLRKSNINIFAIHHHMSGEEPRYL